MNPYAKYVSGGDPSEIIAATPQRLTDLVHRLTPERLTETPAPGKWSVRDILCHLADTEIAFAFRLRQALAEPNHVIQPFDQAKWAAPYESLPAASALAAFTAVRNWNRALLAAVPAEAYAKPVTHPERGEMTFRTIVETMAGHDNNHLQQIEALSMGPPINADERR